MILQANAVAIRQNLDEMLDQVQRRRDVVVINSFGKPVAALIDFQLFQQICRLHAHFDSLCKRFEESFSVWEDVEGTAEIERAISEHRKKSRLRQ